MNLIIDQTVYCQYPVPVIMHTPHENIFENNSPSKNCYIKIPMVLGICVVIPTFFILQIVY